MNSERPFTPPADVVGRKVGDSMVLVRLTTNQIYELNVTAARIWELLKDGLAPEAIVDRLADEFDTGPADIAAEIDALLDALRGEELA